MMLDLMLGDEMGHRGRVVPRPLLAPTLDTAVDEVLDAVLDGLVDQRRTLLNLALQRGILAHRHLDRVHAPDRHRPGRRLRR